MILKLLSVKFTKEVDFDSEHYKSRNRNLKGKKRKNGDLDYIVCVCMGYNTIYLKQYPIKCCKRFHSLLPVTLRVPAKIH